MSDSQTPSRPTTGAWPATRLGGRKLTAARGFWAGILLLSLALFALYLSKLPASWQPLDTAANLALVRQVITLLVCLAAGVGLFWLRPNEWMAIYTSAAMLLIGCIPLAIHMITTPSDSQPAIGGINWLPILITPIIVALNVNLLLIYPDGKYTPAWTRWLLLPIALIAIAYPIEWRLLRPLPVSFILLIIMILIGLVLQVNRMRRAANFTQQQQIKWFLVGIAWYVVFQVAAMGLISVALTTPWLDSRFLQVESLLSTTLLAISYVIPLSTFFFALVRYRLWDINIVINRSLVYGLLTLLLAGVFAVGFSGLRLGLERLLGGEQATLSAIIATALVVGLFTPIRNRLRQFVDRRFFGIAMDYQAARRTNAPRPASHKTAAILPPAFDLANLELIGRGGMSAIYRADHPTLGKPVAIKTLLPQMSEMEEARKRFTREAQTIAALQHPNIIALYDYGEKDGLFYMQLEFIDGVTLSNLIKQRGRLELPEALPILKDIAAALDYAHGRGIIHRDIKPSNIMIENGSRRAVLMDFGIAHLTSSMTQLTQAGNVVGTLEYIAPEQIRGAQGIDQRADIYSLGVVAYQMLCGELPFKHANAGALVMAHLMEPPPDLRQADPAIPRRVAQAVARALAKDPAERFASAGEMLAALAG